MDVVASFTQNDTLKGNFTIDKNLTVPDFTTTETDFWDGMFSWGVMKVGAVILGFITSFGLPLAIYNIIDYNTSRHIISILHRMELGVMWSGLVSIAPIQFIELLRMIFGFMRNCPLVGAMIYFDAIVIFRYTFIFIWKSVAAINDDLIARVIFLSVSLWCLLYGFVFMTLPGKMAINYYMCTGQNPDVDFYSFKKFPINAIVPMVSLLLYFGLSLKIAHQRWKWVQEVKRGFKVMLQEDKGQSSTSGYGTASSGSTKSTTDNSISSLSKTKLPKSTVSLIAILFVSLSIIIESVLWSLVVNKWSAEEIMSDNFATFVVYWHNNYGPMIYVWIFMALSYAKNPSLLQNGKELMNLA